LRDRCGRLRWPTIAVHQDRPVSARQPSSAASRALSARVAVRPIFRGVCNATRLGSGTVRLHIS